MKKALLVLFLLSAFSCNTNAAPSITSAIATDTVRWAEVTIAGSNFLTKANANPYLWWDGENGSLNPSNMGQHTSWDETITNLSLNTTDVMYGDSAYQVKGMIDGGTSHTSASFRSDFSVAATTVVLYLDRRWSYSSASLPNTTNHKIFRLWSTTQDHDYVFSTDQGGIGLNECDSNYPSRYSAGSFPANSWGHETWIWTHGSDYTSTPPGDVSDGIAKWVKNGTTIHNQTDVPNCANDHTQLRASDNFCSDCPSAGNYVLMDNIYIDNTYSRVEVSTASTYAASNNLKPLILESWASDGTSVTGKLFLGDIAASSTLYVYVHDYLDAVNSNGVQITASAPAATPNSTTSVFNGYHTR